MCSNGTAKAMREDGELIVFFSIVCYVVDDVVYASAHGIADVIVFEVAHGVEGDVG